MDTILPPAYRSWEQLAGYFDGDGSVSLHVAKHVLRFRIRFVDTWKPQIEAIHAFLIGNGIRATSVNRDNSLDPRSGFRVEVGAVKDVLKLAKILRPLCVKKARDLQITIDYLEGRITGDQAVLMFNQEVESGRRSGIIRHSNMPVTREVGLRQKEVENAAKARAAHAVQVSPEIRDQIRLDHINNKLGAIRLSRKYGYSEKVIRRVLRGD